MQNNPPQISSPEPQESMITKSVGGSKESHFQGVNARYQKHTLVGLGGVLLFLVVVVVW